MKHYQASWVKGLQSLIRKKLIELGPLDSHQAANACQVSPDAAAPRFSELEADGLVRFTGEFHSSPSGRGRKRKVWEAVV